VLGTDTIAAKVAGRRELAPGTSVGLDWSPADCHFFDAGTGMRRDDVVSLSIH
jgi:peptidyl-tRNA hydrolase